MNNINDTNTICRTCAAPPDDSVIYTPLFEGKGSTKCVSKDILELTAMLQLNLRQNDGLPQKICFNCLKSFAVISEFRKRCEEVQKILNFLHKASPIIVLPKGIHKNIENTKKNVDGLENTYKGVETAIKKEELYEPTDFPTGDVNIKNVDKGKSYQLSDDRKDFKDPKRQSTLVCLKRIKTKDSSLTTVHFADGRSRRVDFRESIDRDEKTFGTDHTVHNFKAENVIDGTVVTAPDRLDHAFVSSDDDIEEFDYKDENWENPFSISSEDSDIDGHSLSTQNMNNSTAKSKRNGKRTNNTKPKEKIMERQKSKCPYCHEQFFLISSHTSKCPARSGHICKYCDLALGTDLELKDHVENMHPDGLPACHICFASFNNTQLRRQHIKLEHQQIKFICDTCGRAFTKRKTLHEHMQRTHTEIINKKCPKCPKLLKTEFLYQRHLKQHEMEDILKCQYCGKLLSRMQFKINHERIHTGERPYLCEFCGFGFATLVELNFHKKMTHHPNKESIRQNYREKMKHYQKRLKLAKTKMIGKNAIGKKLKCAFCPYEFATSYGLDQHLRKHAEARKYICEQCGNGFHRQMHLKLHEKRVHLKKRDHKCSECGKEFFERHELNHHMMLHRGDRPFECEHCLARFKEKRKLKAHLRTHTNERPYICDICGKTYRNPTGLRGHFEGHTEEEIKQVERKLLTSIEALKNTEQLIEILEPDMIQMDKDDIIVDEIENIEPDL